MKKIYLVILSLYCVTKTNVVVSGLSRDLINMNRSVCEAVRNGLNPNNLSTSFVALFSHNIVSKRSSNLFDLKDNHMIACLAGGWIGDALSRVSFIKDLPTLVKVPFKYPFASCWLLYNFIVNRDKIMQDPANLVVGSYIVLNTINDCNE